MENNVSEVLYSELTDLNNIVSSIELAISAKTDSRLFFDPEEFSQEINIKTLSEQTLEFFRSPVPKFLTGIEFGIPYNRYCDRCGVYLDLFASSILFSLGRLFYKYLDKAFPITVFTWKHNFFLSKPSNSSPDEIIEKFNRWCNKYYPNDSNCLLQLDISNFFDSVDHQILIDKISNKLGVSVNSKLMTIFKRCLTIRTETFGNPNFMNKGLPLGNGIEEYLSNLLLLDFDLEMSKNSSFEYSRLINDELIFICPNYSESKNTVRIVADALKPLNLKLNYSKTRIYTENEELLFNEVMEAVNPYDIFSGYRFVKSEGSKIKYDDPQSNFILNQESNFETEKDAKTFIKEFNSRTLPSDLDESMNNLLIDKTTIIFYKYPIGQYFNFEISDLLITLTFGRINKVVAPNRVWEIMTFNLEKPISTITKGLSSIIQILESDRIPDYSKYTLIRAIFNTSNTSSKSLEDSYFLFFVDSIHYMEKDIHDTTLGSIREHYRKLLIQRLESFAQNDSDYALKSYSNYALKKIVEYNKILMKKQEEWMN